MPPRPDLGILLGLAFESFVARLHEAMAAQGFDDLGSAYGFVFRALDGRALSVGELAQALAITTQGASKLAGEMERARYLERVADAQDARVTRLRLAARGRAALATARRFHRRFERGLQASLGARPVAGLRRALTAVAESVPGEPASRRLVRPF